MQNMGIIKPNWSNDHKVLMYNNLVRDKISNITPICTNKLNEEELKIKVNERLEHVNSIFISTTKEAGCLPIKVLKAKTYWCPELSQLRDKKRFWWSLWVSNGRPQSGIVYDILKDLKKKFRKISRSNINKLAMKDTNRINTEFKNKNLNIIWNKLKIHKKLKVNSNLKAEDFKIYFNVLMQDVVPLNAD